MSIEWREYTLTGETIDRISERVQEECTRLGTDKREIQRIRLSVEAILIRVQEHSEEAIPIETGIGSRFGEQLFLLRYGGPSLDPTDHDEDDWSSTILASLGISPTWSFRGKKNIISFTLAARRRHGTAFDILVAVGAAIVFGFLGRLLPESVRGELDSLLLTPLADGFLGLLNTFAGLMLLLTAWQTHTPVFLLIRKILPPFLVAFTTASSISAFQSSMDTGRGKLGIDSSFLSFAYPIGSVMYMPSAAICLVVMAVYCAKEYDLSVNPSWLITAVVITTLLAIAVPPLPGSGFMIISTMLAQLGIPAEALLVITLCYVIVDYVISGVDVGALLLELTREAHQSNLLDQKTLRTK